MKSALSTQNRQTFFLRTKLRLPRFAGPPPGPLGRPPGPPGPPPPGPDGRPPPNEDPPCPPPCDCCPPCSSAIRYLPNMIPTKLPGLIARISLLVLIARDRAQILPALSELR